MIPAADHSAPPAFPPLISGRAAATDDPFAEARALAREGCEAGLVVYRNAPERLSAALILAPEVSLADAVAMLPVCGIGVQNALGALAPPEVAVHLRWSGDVLVNGARAGRLRIAAPDRNADACPDWLVVGLDLDFVLPLAAPGETPDTTALYEEGCGDLEPLPLLEAWLRHTLVWLHRWETEGNRPIHAEWSGLLSDIPRDDAAIGLDERFGKLVRDGATTRLVPLTELLETP
jgi:biotin-(acetyl-CoA carboxylase) ligase